MKSGKELFEDETTTGHQSVNVGRLRDATARQGGCRKGIPLYDCDAVEVVTQNTRR
ncbi:MAG: hypothetical protein ACREXM_12070 [Gammaproteobacteria bacterium]